MMTELFLDHPHGAILDVSRAIAPSDVPDHLLSWTTRWLRGNLQHLRVSDRVDDGRPSDRGLAYLEIRSGASIEQEALLGLRYVLYVQRECFRMMNGLWKRDDFRLKLACEPIAAERLSATAWRLTLKIANVPTIRDLAEAWSLILDEADASGQGEGRRGWGADVRRVVFYHPHAPSTKCAAPNRDYLPPNDVRIGQVLARLPEDGLTEIIDLDAAFDDMACVPDEEAFEGMEAARRAEKALAAAS